MLQHSVFKLFFFITRSALQPQEGGTAASCKNAFSSLPKLLVLLENKTA